MAQNGTRTGDSTSPKAVRDGPDGRDRSRVTAGATSSRPRELMSRLAVRMTSSAAEDDRPAQDVEEDLDQAADRRDGRAVHDEEAGAGGRQRDAGE